MPFNTVAFLAGFLEEFLEENVQYHAKYCACMFALKLTFDICMLKNIINNTDYYYTLPNL